MFFLFSFGFMSTLNRKISIRISAAINLFLDCFTMLRVPACPAVATPAQLVPQRMCQTLCVRAKAQPHGTTWGPRHAEKMPGCWSAVRADSGTALLPILGLGDFTLAKCSILLQVTACSESTNAAHRGSKQLWVTFAKLLQPTFETDEWNTSSIFSNIGTFGKKQGGQHMVQWTSQSSQLSSSLPRLVLHYSAPSRSWIPSLWQSTLTPAKTRQASGPASNTLNNTTEMTVSTLAKTELAFK